MAIWLLKSASAIRHEKTMSRATKPTPSAN